MKLLQKIKNCFDWMLARVRPVMANDRAEGYVDTGIKIIISVVLGGLILAGLYTLFDSTILPTLTEKISEMFSYGS